CSRLQHTTRPTISTASSNSGVPQNAIPEAHLRRRIRRGRAVRQPASPRQTRVLEPATRASPLPSFGALARKAARSAGSLTPRAHASASEGARKVVEEGARMAQQHKTLLEALEANTEKAADKSLFTYVGDKGEVVKSFTYEQFDAATSRLASAMVCEGGWGLEAGDNLLLVYPPGLDFIVAFVACLKAGVVAVPVYPPRPGMSKDLKMFVAVQSSCKATVALTSSAYDFAKRVTGFKQLFTGGAKWPSLRWLVSDAGKLPNGVRGSYQEVVPAPMRDTLAFLQYTSGSTSAPKGVMITHGNLAHNLATIILALKASDDTVVASWLPQYHDMGLIGSHLGALYCGGSGTYMSPISFIKDPPLWLRIASQYGATHLQAPNFAYKLVVRKWREQGGNPADLSLATVRHIFNAAEPIELDAMEDFMKTFKAAGLQGSAMSPGYGLAEHTVYVSDAGSQVLYVNKQALETERRVVTGMDPSDAGTAIMIGCGNPHRHGSSVGIKVKIVNEDNAHVLGEDAVGEIWVTSPSKAAGYFGMEAKTEESFGAKIAGESGEEDDSDTYLRTGDLGFFHNDELFICGRLKDLIIIRGRNHFPQDIEHTTEQADALIRPGCVAAFTVQDSHGQGERLGVVAEVRDSKSHDLAKLSEKLRRRIVSEHGVAPHVLVLIKDRTIPKTTSGKISRFRAKAALENGELQELHHYEGTPAGEDDDEDAADLAADAPGSNMSSDDATAATGGQNASPAASAGAGKPSSGPKPTPIGESAADKRGPGLRGDDLLDALKEEVARLTEGDPDMLDPNAPLFQLGMDSVTLTQFKGILSNAYGVEIEEFELFDEDTSLHYIQRRVEGEPMAAKFADMANGAPTAPPDTTTTSGGPTHQSSRPAKAKSKRPKQKLFGCFAICGC
ncbi:Polyketide synthase, partial [Hondaea fermentalgiana]